MQTNMSFYIKPGYIGLGAKFEIVLHRGGGRPPPDKACYAPLVSLQTANSNILGHIIKIKRVYGI